MDSRVRDVVGWLGERDERSSERPGLRLLGLALAMVFPLVAIGLRFAQVQLTLGDEYRGEFEQTFERWEPIPSRDGRLLALAHNGQHKHDKPTIDVVERNSGRVLATFTGHGRSVRGMAFSADGQLLATASKDGRVKLWKVP